MSVFVDLLVGVGGGVEAFVGGSLAYLFHLVIFDPNFLERSSEPCVLFSCAVTH